MSWTDIKRLKEERTVLINNAKEILNRAHEEKRSINREESDRFDKLHIDADGKLNEIERIERQMKAEKSLEERLGREDFNPIEDRKASDKNSVKRAWKSWFQKPAWELTPEERNLIRNAAYCPDPELRTLGNSAGTGAELIPQDFYYNFYRKLKYFGGVRQAGATIIPSDNGRALPVPVYDDTSNTGQWITAGQSVSTSQEATTSHLVLNGYLVTSGIELVNIDFVQDSAFDPQVFLDTTLRIRLGRTMNAKFTTGAGGTEPQGVATGASLGCTAASATAVAYNDVLNLIHSVDPSYAAVDPEEGQEDASPLIAGETGLRLMFTYNTLLALKKLTDSQNRPLWLPGSSIAGSIAGSTPPTINGVPYVVNNDMAEIPGTTGQNARAMLCGNFKMGYVIRDVRGGGLVKFDQVYMPNLQVGFMVYARADAGVRDSKAIKYCNFN